MQLQKLRIAVKLRPSKKKNDKKPRSTDTELGQSNSSKLGHEIDEVDLERESRSWIEGEKEKPI